MKIDEKLFFIMIINKINKICYQKNNTQIVNKDNSLFYHIIFHPSVFATLRPDKSGEVEASICCVTKDSQ
jgi:hypothetical protein